MRAARTGLPAVPNRALAIEKYGMTSEIELKLELPRAAADEVARLPWLRELACGPARHEKLVTVYFHPATGERWLVARLHEGDNEQQQHRRGHHDIVRPLDCRHHRR